ncbi:hypothetical protein [Natronomonas gomsonensis]|uniref:hypothetical protein n=1 Tax=Natronomonas gomsonensis TaxID=1046043 RepID=UPI0015BDBD14|nr:hypothetical protein [Natronomonas gomsonensis]
MSQRASERRTWTRRGVVSAAAAVCCGLAGCGNDRPSETDGNGTPNEPQTEERRSEQLLDIEARLERVYERLTALPLVDDGDFVFDVSAFEDEFDHRAISDRTDKILADVAELEDSGEISTSRAETLSALARLADDRASQRYLLHQTIAATFAYDERVRDSRYDAATEPVVFAGEALEELSTVGQRVETHQQQLEDTNVTVDSYSYGTVKREQAMLLDVVTWLSPINGALHEMARGYALLDDANRSLEDDDSATAIEQYRAANARFESANDSFEEARGRGQRVGYVVPIVEQSRCSLSGLLDGTETLAEAIEKIEAGNEQEGESLAREAIQRMEQQRNRCY